MIKLPVNLETGEVGARAYVMLIEAGAKHTFAIDPDSPEIRELREALGRLDGSEVSRVRLGAVYQRALVVANRYADRFRAEMN